jgi:uncharacterized protein
METMEGEPDFEWDEEENVRKVEAHGVTPTEAEDALLDPAAVSTRAESTPTERRQAVIGRTAAGRILVVVFTERHDAFRVITVYDASARARRQYRRGKG